MLFINYYNFFFFMYRYVWPRVEQKYLYFKKKENEENQ